MGEVGEGGRVNGIVGRVVDFISLLPLISVVSLRLLLLTSVVVVGLLLVLLTSIVFPGLRLVVLTLVVIAGLPTVVILVKKHNNHNKKIGD